MLALPALTSRKLTDTDTRDLILNRNFCLRKDYRKAALSGLFFRPLRTKADVELFTTLFVRLADLNEAGISALVARLSSWPASVRLGVIAYGDVKTTHGP